LGLYPAGPTLDSPTALTPAAKGLFASADRNATRRAGAAPPKIELNPPIAALIAARRARESVRFIKTVFESKDQEGHLGPLERRGTQHGSNFKVPPGAGKRLPAVGLTAMPCGRSEPVSMRTHTARPFKRIWPLLIVRPRKRCARGGRGRFSGFQRLPARPALGTRPARITLEGPPRNKSRNMKRWQVQKSGPRQQETPAEGDSGSCQQTQASENAVGNPRRSLHAREGMSKAPELGFKTQSPPRNGAPNNRFRRAPPGQNGPWAEWGRIRWGTYGSANLGSRPFAYVKR